MESNTEIQLVDKISNKFKDFIAAIKNLMDKK